MTKVTKSKQSKPADGQGEKRPVSKAAAKRAASKTPEGKKAKARAAKQAKAGSRGGLMKFLRDVRIEMGKVTWPTRKDLVQSTMVVIVVVLIVATFVGIADFGFSRFVAWFIQLIAK